MTQELENLGKQAFDEGVKLYLLEKITLSSDFFKLAANAGNMSAKILIASGKYNIKTPYWGGPEEIKIRLEESSTFTKSDFDIIKRRAKLPTASPEDIRNLGLCHFYGLPTRENLDTNEGYTLLLQAANKGDSLALNLIPGHIDSHLKILFPSDAIIPYTLENKNKLKCQYLCKASEAGSIGATCELTHNRTAKENSLNDIANHARHKFQLLKAEFLASQANAKLEALKIKFEKFKTIPMLSIQEFILCNYKIIPSELIILIGRTIGNVLSKQNLFAVSVQKFYEGTIPLSMPNTAFASSTQSSTYANYTTTPNLPASVGNLLASTGSTARSDANVINTKQFGALMNQAPSVPTTPLPSPDAVDTVQNDSQEKGDKLRVGISS